MLRRDFVCVCVFWQLRGSGQQADIKQKNGTVLLIARLMYSVCLCHLHDTCVWVSECVWWTILPELKYLIDSIDNQVHLRFMHLSMPFQWVITHAVSNTRSGMCLSTAGAAADHVLRSTLVWINWISSLYRPKLNHSYFTFLQMTTRNDWFGTSFVYNVICYRYPRPFLYLMIFIIIVCHRYYSTFLVTVPRKPSVLT